VTVEADVVNLFSTVTQRHGRLDILVNNAGVTIAKPTDQIPLQDWKRVVDTNLTGAFLCSREALKIMKPQNSGRIISIGSISSITPRSNGAAYAATKLALEGLTRSIALDYREHNIGASIIHLGATASGWMKVRPEDATGPEYHLPLADVGRLAVFMASLPTEANMFETTILPIQQRSFVGRG
jgi:NAD(P)-dependent dehydrogenase (short-subunit alcohol dehydrogenase family)